MSKKITLELLPDYVIGGSEHYWSLCINDIECGSGLFADMIEFISEFKTFEDAEAYANEIVEEEEARWNEYKER